MLSRSMSAWVVPVKFWNPAIRPAGMPVSRTASRSARSAVVQRRQVGEDAGVQHRQQPRQLGLGHEAGELVVPVGTDAVPPVLLGHRDDDLVEQRVAEPRTPGSRGRRCATRSCGRGTPRLLAVGRAPHADGGLARPSGRVGTCPSPGHVRDRAPRWRWCARWPGPVSRRRRRWPSGSGAATGRAAASPGRTPSPGRRRTRRPAGRRTPGSPPSQAGDGRIGEVRVVGRGPRPDVARRAGHPAGERLATPPGDPGDRVALAAVPVGAVERSRSARCCTGRCSGWC